MISLLEETVLRPFTFNVLLPVTVSFKEPILAVTDPITSSFLSPLKHQNKFYKVLRFP